MSYNDQPPNYGAPQEQPPSSPYGPQPLYPQQPPSAQPQYPQQPPSGYPPPYPQQQPSPSGYPPAYPPPAYPAPGYEQPAQGYGQPQPSPPYSQPPAFGQPPYSQQPPPMYGQPPYPPPAPKKSSNGALIGGIVAVAVVALIGVFFALAHKGPSTTGSGSSTSTSTSSTTTSVAPAYSAAVPDCGSDAGKWQASSNTTPQCNASSVTITNPVTSNFISQLSHTLASSPANYDTSVHIANIANGCAGLGVLGDQLKSYVGYVCADGSWVLNNYDAGGTHHKIDGGSGVDTSGDILLDIKISGATLTFSANGTTLSTQTIQSGYTTTSYVSLNVAGTSTTSDCTADFSNFALSLG